jgi:hypothetical protein
MTRQTTITPAWPALHNGSMAHQPLYRLKIPKWNLIGIADDLPLVKVEQTKWEKLDFQIITVTKTAESPTHGICLCGACDEHRSLYVLEFEWACIAHEVVCVANVMEVATNAIITRDGIPISEAEALGCRLRNLASTNWHKLAIATVANG